MRYRTLPRSSNLLLPFTLIALHCGTKPEAPPRVVEKGVSMPPATAAPEVLQLEGGSSDGMTCEEARNAHPDDLGSKVGPEPPDRAFSEVLVSGAYLNACGVPEETRISICTAIADGAVMGVTVATSPSDPEIEKCVAGNVRTLTFPAHPRLKVVRTSF